MPQLPVAQLADLATRFSFLVDERDLTGTPLAPVVAAGTRQTLTTADYLLHFSIETWQPNSLLLRVTRAARGGSAPCYFLPYCPDAATEIVLGPNANHFFTSTLSGCTVKVHGPPATPTIIHANARSTYRNTVATTAAAAPNGFSALAKAMRAEAAGAHSAQAAIDLMLGGAVVGEAIVRKSDYLGKLTNANIEWAKQRFVVEEGFRVKVFRPHTDGDDYKLPKVGAFVYGLRDAGTGNWAVYYQSTAAIVGKKKKSRFLRSSIVQELLPDDAVLCLPDRIFP
jgi:hypothetical protein